MQKTYWILIILAVLFGIIGYFLGWFDNGPQQTNYDIPSLPNRLDQ